MLKEYRKTATIKADNLDDASFCEGFDDVKKIAEKIGGKVYKVNLEEVE
jgi:hypothetical protein